MTVLVCGSLSYDTIMSFDDKFSNHVLPKHLNIFNVAFSASGLRKEYGGCAGNICYNLGLLGCKSAPVATVGEDSERYIKRMHKIGMASFYVKTIANVYTAQSFITTDITGNQVATYYAGAMHQSHQNILPELIDNPAEIQLGVISPDGNQGMVSHAQQFTEMGVPFIFDPGQEMPSLNEQQLKRFLEQADWMIVNDYEWRIFVEKTNMTIEQVLVYLKALIITKGSRGSEIYTSDEVYEITAVPVKEAVDPTGCGDAYRSGIVYGLINQLGWQTTGQIGALMGAINVANSGAQNHKFTMEEFRGFYQQHYSEELLAL